MQGLVDRIFESKSLTVLVIAIGLVAAAAAALLAARFFFGRRVKAPNGRARAPRLGVVDVFDVDRRRQLILVRRDNIEHLVMIGGPNDVLIESEIVRAEGRERLREKESRDKEPAAPVLAQPAAQQTPQPSPPPATEPAFEPAPPRAASARGAPEATAEAAALAAEGTAPAVDSSPAPARRPVGPLAPRPPRESFLRPEPAPRPEGASPANPFPRAPLATPFLRPLSAPRQLAETLGRRPAPRVGQPPSQPGEPAPGAATGAPRDVPAKDVSVKDVSVKDMPADDLAAKDASANDLRTNDSPAKDAPARDGSATGAAPALVAAEQASAVAGLSAGPSLDLAAALAQALEIGDEPPPPREQQARRPQAVELARAQANEEPAGDSLEEEMARLLGRGNGAP